MSKSRIGMAAAGVAMVALGALPSAAEAGFRLRVGGPVGVARFGVARVRVPRSGECAGSERRDP